MHPIQTWFLSLAASVTLIACGGGDDNLTPSKHLLGVKVSGLATGYTLVLQNNGSNDLTVPTSGQFTFSQPVLHGASYTVTVKSQPPRHGCSVDGANTGKLVSDGVLISIVCFTNGTLPPPPGSGTPNAQLIHSFPKDHRDFMKARSIKVGQAQQQFAFEPLAAVVPGQSFEHVHATGVLPAASKTRICTGVCATPIDARHST